MGLTRAVLASRDWTRGTTNRNLLEELCDGQKGAMDQL